jgi:RHS repeat-associated protein
MKPDVRWWELVVCLVLFSVVGTLGAANRPKFQPSESGGVGIGRYVVTLAEDTVADDLGSLKRELALLYGARLEANPPAGPQQFTVTMLPSRARLLGVDPRVFEVVEVPMATTPAASPETPAVGLPSAPLPRRLTPQPSGFGNDGQSGTYTYDGAGNITAIGADTYRYDTAQGLVSSVTRGVQEDFSYDAFGNRKSATGAVNCLGQLTCAQTVTVDSSSNHLTTINGAAVTYDDAGNIKTISAFSGDPGAVYSYDGTGMMTEATVGSDDRQFLYTADDERIAVKQGASWTWTVRDLSGKVLREFTSLETGPNLAMTHWQWAKDYIWRDGLLLATTTATGTLHYHLDHLGTPRLVTDANGVKVAEHAYYPFGAEINLTPHETPEEAMKFTGHERDIVAGDGHTLDYMHARYDNASLGRFLSVDPGLDQKRAMTNPQAWNRYVYVENNPLNRTDPDGRCSKPAGAGGDVVGVCIEGFIAAAKLKVIGHGDNRTFAANDPSKTSRVQVQMLVNTKTGSIKATTTPGVSTASAGPFAISRTGTASTTLSGATVQSDGTIGVTAQTAATNGLRNFPTAPKDSIDFKINLVITPDGRVGLAGGRTDGYPSIGIYGYSDRGTQTVYERREGSPDDLAPPMEVVILVVHPE